MTKRGGLGRGLDALIPKRNGNDTQQTETEKTRNKKSAVDEKQISQPKQKQKTAKQEKDEDNHGISDEVKKMADAIISGNTENGSIEKEEMSEDSDINRAGKEEKISLKAAAPENVKTGVQETGDTVINMRLSDIEPNRDQPRKYFDEEAINELADSVKQFGIISPLLVQKKDDYYEIIAGERRWRAARKAGLKEVPVIIREFSSQEAVEISLIENIQREDLNPIEEARAYERLVTEYGLAQEAVAGRVSKSRSAVANSMRLLKLGPEVQKLVETGELSEGHARTIIPVASAELQKNIAEQILKDHLSVRQTEKLVRDILEPGKTALARKSTSETDALLSSLSENLKTALGTKVFIRKNGKNKGRIEIEYYSEEELDRIYELLRSVH